MSFRWLETLYNFHIWHCILWTTITGMSVDPSQPNVTPDPPSYAGGIPSSLGCVSKPWTAIYTAQMRARTALN